MVKAKSTIGTVLQVNVGTTETPDWQQVYPIKSYSGFDVENGTVDSTTMDNEEYTSKIKTLKDLDKLTFDVNETAEIVQIINSMEDEDYEFRLLKQQTGVYHRLTGQIEYTTMDGNVNDGDFGKLVIIPSDMSKAQVQALIAATIATITDVVDLAVDELRDVEATITPTDGTLSATSSDPTMVTVIASGTTIQLLGKVSGTVTITAKVVKLGYVKATTTFDVTVV